MGRNLRKDIAVGWRKPGWNGIVSIAMGLGIFTSLTACGRQVPSDIAIFPADTEDGTEISSVAMEDSSESAAAAMEDSLESASAVMEDRTELLSADIGMNEKGSVEIQDELSDKYETSVSYTDLCNIASTACDMHVEESLIKTIEEKVILRDDTEIEVCEWVDEEKSCLRIRVQYKEYPPDNYRHKEDYFFFLEEDNIQTLHVEYPTKDWHNMEEDRYVWDACDFAAHLEDVTFDGRDDLVIFLGHAGSRGDLIHGVYVYEDGLYCYKPGFEDIPNYEADVKEQVIRGWCIDSAVRSTTYVFRFQNSDFELISYEDYDTDVPGFNSYDTFP